MKRIICIIILIICLILLYGFYIESYTLKVKEYSITSEHLPKGFDGFKIVQFSDTLIYKSNDLLSKTVQKINELNADIVIFTGDLFNKNASDSIKDETKSLIEKISAKLYKYYIPGDLDDETLIDYLPDFIKVDKELLLYNEDETPIRVLTNNIDISKGTYFNLFLIHKPDNVSDISFPDGYNLCLSAHSLGGQINIPFYGPLIRNEGATTYFDEYYQKDNFDLYLNYGLGTNYIRLFNHPSISLYRLNSK